jgi:hypothetical protein
MDWSQVGSLIAPMAPTIGSILGGFIPVPGGAVLGQVAGKIVAEALGVPPTPEAVNTAVTTGDPAVVSAKLSEAETKMNAEVERFRLSVQDVQDARATTVKLDASGSSIAWGAPVISVVIVVGFLLGDEFAFHHQNRLRARNSDIAQRPVRRPDPGIRSGLQLLARVVGWFGKQGCNHCFIAGCSFSGC